MKENLNGQLQHKSDQREIIEHKRSSILFEGPLAQLQLLLQRHGDVKHGRRPHQRDRKSIEHRGHFDLH